MMWCLLEIPCVRCVFLIKSGFLSKSQRIGLRFELLFNVAALISKKDLLILCVYSLHTVQCFDSSLFVGPLSKVLSNFFWHQPLIVVFVLVVQAELKDEAEKPSESAEKSDKTETTEKVKKEGGEASEREEENEEEGEAKTDSAGNRTMKP